jgi:hypothetical protein
MEAVILLGGLGSRISGSNEFVICCGAKSCDRTIVQISGGANELDQLVYEAKTLRGLIESTTSGENQKWAGLRQLVSRLNL